MVERLRIRPDKIVHIRRRFELSQPEFAALLGASVRTLQRWERGTLVPGEPAVEILLICERVCDDDLHVLRVRKLIKRNTERPAVLWYLLNFVYRNRLVDL